MKTAPEMAVPYIEDRLRAVGGAILNESDYYAAVTKVEAFIGREMTGDEYRIACVMMGNAKGAR